MQLGVAAFTHTIFMSIFFLNLWQNPGNKILVDPIYYAQILTVKI